MIREAVGEKRQPQTSQVIEKALRLTDTGYSVQLRAGKISRATGCHRLIETVEPISQKAHRKSRRRKSQCWRYGDSIENHRIHLIQTRDRFPQRSSGQGPTVHQAALIEYRNLDIPLEAIVLQAVIGNDQIAFRIVREQAPRRRRPVATDENRAGTMPGQQDWFVTDYPGVTAGGDFQYSPAVTMVAPTDNPRMSPSGTQGARQMNHQGGLAGTSD